MGQLGFVNKSHSRQYKQNRIKRTKSIPHDVLVNLEMKNETENSLVSELNELVQTLQIKIKNLERENTILRMTIRDAADTSVIIPPSIVETLPHHVSLYEPKYIIESLEPSSPILSKAPEPSSPILSKAPEPSGPILSKAPEQKESLMTSMGPMGRDSGQIDVQRNISTVVNEKKDFLFELKKKCEEISTRIEEKENEIEKIPVHDTIDLIDPILPNNDPKKVHKRTYSSLIKTNFLQSSRRVTTSVSG